MSVLAVIELPHRPLLKRGSTVTLLCNVSVVITGPTQVEVQWWHEKRELDGKEDMPPGHAKGSILATLTYDGLSRIYSNGSELSIDRVSAGLQTSTDYASFQHMRMTKGITIARQKYGPKTPMEPGTIQVPGQSPPRYTYIYMHEVSLRK